MLVLTLDTSTPAVTAAVSRVQQPPGARPDRILPAGSLLETVASRTEVATNSHGELLAPLVEELLREAGALPTDLAAVGVGLGPGPFTGLRVGIMTAAALGDALGIPVYGECSLDVMASSLHGTDSYAVMTDARRKQVYWAAYDAAGRRVEGPDVGTPAAVAEHLAGRVSRVSGAGALAYPDQLCGFQVIGDGAFPDAAALARCVAGKVTRHAPGDDLTPLYLRRPDATPPGPPKQVTPA